MLGRAYPGWTRTELMALTPQRLIGLINAIPKPKPPGQKGGGRR